MTETTTRSAGLQPPASEVSPRRVALAGVICLTMFASIVAIFWHEDLRFARPTPIPAGWQAVATGVPVALPADIERLRSAAPGRPILLHFFNPNCPCSRFNIDHVQQLIARYGSRVTFVAVLTEDRPSVLVAAYARLGLTIPPYVDDGRLAAAVGAYSTPQAAILDVQGRLVYRGNYNTNRYCRDARTEFARLALDALLNGDAPPALPEAATVAYGCPLRGRATTGIGS